MKNFLSKFAAAAAFAGLFTSSAMAAPMSLDMVWSGASFGNTASAFGTLVADDSVLTTGGDIGMASLMSLDITVNGVGSFDKDDFFVAYIRGMGTLDFSKQLIGQLLPNKCKFGTSTDACGNGTSGDFNFISGEPDAPRGTWYFEMSTADGQKMLLTSLKQTGIVEVPEPGSLALFGLALAGAAFARRKQA